MWQIIVEILNIADVLSPGLYFKSLFVCTIYTYTLFYISISLKYAGVFFIPASILCFIYVFLPVVVSFLFCLVYVFILLSNDILYNYCLIHMSIVVVVWMFCALCDLLATLKELHPKQLWQAKSKKINSKILSGDPSQPGLCLC